MHFSDIYRQKSYFHKKVVNWTEYLLNLHKFYAVSNFTYELSKCNRLFLHVIIIYYSRIKIKSETQFDLLDFVNLWDFAYLSICI